MILQYYSFLYFYNDFMMSGREDPKIAPNQTEIYDR